MSTSCPRIIIAGLNGGSGKTIVSIGLARSWHRAGRAVKPFKKGPDYIDAKWLSLASGITATNLDLYLTPKPVMLSLFKSGAAAYDGALIEGNRGIYDGRDIAGSYSTAELARILDAPVVLVMDCTKMTRTAAAVVRGIIDFEPDVKIAGVILNRTANDRHRAVLREAITHYTGLPVLGALPKLRQNPLPERHMGLISDQEYAKSNQAIETVADFISGHVDISRIWELACQAAPLKAEHGSRDDVWSGISRVLPIESPAVRIGYVRDAALWFYYEENLEALRRAGAELIPLSLLDRGKWPELDGLYLGGGFPETLAEPLANNIEIREHVKTLAQNGMPVYAECGGLMFLARNLIYKGNTYPMADVLPVTTEICERPQGLGYIDAAVIKENPYHPSGSIIRGHEFHYSRCFVHDDANPVFCLTVNKGFNGKISDRDGLLSGNVFASYLHLFALGEPHWAGRFVMAAERYRLKR